MPNDPKDFPPEQPPLVRKPYKTIGPKAAAREDCSKTCYNFPRGCAVCNGAIMYIDKETV